MTLQQIEYVAALAQEGSFSKAARKLSVSQPSLSQYIINIETQIGATLFDRGSTPIRLTAAGEVYLRSAMQIKVIEENLKNEISDMANLLKGTLHIGTTMFRAALMLPQSIVAFCQQFEGINVTVTEDSSQNLLEQVLSGKIDLFIGTGNYDHKLFETEPLSEERLVLAVPKNSPLNGHLDGSQLSVEDIVNCSMKYLTATPANLKATDGERLIICEDGEFSAAAIDKLYAGSGVAPNYALRVHAVETAFAYVNAGFGSAFIPDSLIRYGSHSVHPNYYMLPDAKVKSNICLVYRKNGYLTKAAQQYALLLKKLVNVGTWRTL